MQNAAPRLAGVLSSGTALAACFVDALIKANKDFDLLMIPNAGHGYAGASNYMTRRRWDYFTRYLLGAEPPARYVIGAEPQVPAAGSRGGGAR